VYNSKIVIATLAARLLCAGRIQKKWGGGVVRITTRIDRLDDSESIDRRT
jgi:hypothetical protein